jgi:uncharacterized protein involved in exopolysaccharide biosynthesis
MINEFQENTDKQQNEFRKIMLYLNKKIEILRKNKQILEMKISVSQKKI